MNRGRFCASSSTFLVWQVCQRACKLAIRHEIAEQEAREAEALAKGEEPPEQKLDGVLTKALFDEAMLTARKSVSKTELAKYLKFKKELSGGGSIKAATEAVDAAEAAESGGSDEVAAECFHRGEVR